MTFKFDWCFNAITLLLGLAVTALLVLLLVIRLILLCWQSLLAVVGAGVVVRALEVRTQRYAEA